MNQVAMDTQQEKTKEQERQELMKVKPDLAGFRNGIFIEPDPIDFADHSWVHIAVRWQHAGRMGGHADVWSVKDGAIVGETTTDQYPHTFPNTFLVCRGRRQRTSISSWKSRWKRAEAAVSSIAAAREILRANAAPDENGLRDPRWKMIGPQADFWYPVDETAKSYSGQLYSQNDSRGIIAWRGQVVQSFAGKIPQLVGTIADRAKLGASIKDGSWNQYMIIARGAVILHILNGQLMAALIDDDPASSNNIRGAVWTAG